MLRSWPRWCAACRSGPLAITIYRAVELYSRGGRRGIFNVGKTFFYSEIEPRLEKVRLGERATGYTDRSVDRVIKQGIAKAAAEAR
jgi:hypothetical protein